MELRERQIGSVSVLEVAGRMVVNDDRPEFLRQRVATLISQGQTRLIVDLSEVSQMDTTALAALVSATLTASRRDAHLVMVNPSARIRELFAVSGLDRVFVLCDTEAEAVARLTQTL